VVGILSTRNFAEKFRSSIQIDITDSEITGVGRRKARFIALIHWLGQTSGDTPDSV
jgi:hypothetical protein